MAEWIRRLGARRNAPRETVPECMEAGEAARRGLFHAEHAHQCHIYRKLQVNSRAQLILAYHRVVRHETES